LAVTGPVDADAALTFAVAPDGTSARIITAGRDEVVDLATGAAKPAGGITFAPGDHHAGAQAVPAFDYLPDGRLIGVDPAQSAIAVQTAPGAATVSTLAGLPVKAPEPVRTMIASDASGWTVVGLGTHPQSRLLRYDPATGELSRVNGTFLGVKLAAVAADGAVPMTRRSRKARSGARSCAATSATATRRSARSASSPTSPDRCWPSCG
jgi:hypothetical protein